MYYAIEGCGHGHLHLIYDAIHQLELAASIKIELLIICGDFQATRNADDLLCMAVPPKYKRMGDFPDYYSGKRVAPILTIFVGGNHEASNHLWELYYGGWVAPNIYYLGQSGVVQFAGLRIGGVSGIYQHGHHQLPAYTERVPYNRDSERSIYHVRAFEVNKLSKLTPGTVDVFVSHDWPAGITKFGDEDELLRRKPYFADDIKSNRLGNPMTMTLLQTIQPKYWYSGHLHVKFGAIVPHPAGAAPTRFLALDKPLPNHNFLQVVCAPEVRSDAPRVLCYDAEWLGIIRITHSVLPKSPFRPFKFRPADLAREVDWVAKNIRSLRVPNNFVADVPCGSVGSKGTSLRYLSMDNPQTRQFLALIGMSHHNPFVRAEAALGVLTGGTNSAMEHKPHVEVGKRLQELKEKVDAIMDVTTNATSTAEEYDCCGKEEPVAVNVTKTNDDDDDSDDGNFAIIECSCAGECTCKAKN